MRQVVLLSPLVLLPLAIACAQGSVYTPGGSSTHHSSGTQSGAGGGGVGGAGGGCKLSSSDPTCNTCIETSCCNEAIACADDPGCNVCVGTTTPPASCDTNASLNALAQCLNTSCSTACSGGGNSYTCGDTNNDVGCCDGNGLHYCDPSSGTVTDQSCTGGTVCGWGGNYYDCVSPPASSDPSGTYSMGCSGGSGSSSSSSSSSSGGSSPTWTSIYNTMFGPSGSSTCVKNGGCHTGSQSGFKCGTSKSTCYNGMVSSGLVVQGSGAPSSPLVDPTQSPLCGSLGGNMPKGASCITSSQLTTIKAWLAAGAANN